MRAGVNCFPLRQCQDRVPIILFPGFLQDIFCEVGLQCGYLGDKLLFRAALTEYVGLGGVILIVLRG